MLQTKQPINKKESKMKNLKRLLITAVALSLSMAVPAMAADYDLVIKNGRVIDPETMFDSIANVGIKDGRIRAITPQKITGKKRSTPRVLWWPLASSTRTSIRSMSLRPRWPCATA